MRQLARVQTRRLTIFGAALAISLAIATPATAITWGYADEGLHPNVGAIMGYYGDDWGWLPFCSGTLIHPRIFLSAGHCTSGEYPEYIRVSFDEDPTTLPEDQYLKVVAVITHPQYDGFLPMSNNYDVGALILEEPVEGIEPADVADEGFLDELRKAGLLRQGKEEADFTVVGYGGTLLWPPPGILWEDKRQYSYSEYQVLLKSWLRLSQNHATDDGGSCYGDSGGPAFWGDTLVAITSWGDRPCVATAFCYRADTADTHDLIDLALAWVESEKETSDTTEP
jgi:hypothetical protein